MPLYLILGFSAFLISLLGTRLIILAAKQRPVPIDPRRNPHKRDVPRGGGFAVLIAMVIGLLMADINYVIILSVFIVATMALLSDIMAISLPIKLLTYLIAALLVIGIFPEPMISNALPLWLDRVITAVLWTWFIRIFTRMDGIDGIAPALLISISAGLLIFITLQEKFGGPLSLYSLVLMAAGMGFLWWNWYPAKILFGEIGSAPAGFMLGYLLLLAIQQGYGIAAFILPAYMLSDAVSTVIRRIYQEKPLFKPHSQYYYKRAVHRGRRHDAVVRYIVGINLMATALAVFSAIDTELAVIYAAIAYMGVFMILGFFAHSPYNPHDEPF